MADSVESPENSIQSLGGKARAEKLSAEERREIAKTAAKARWKGAGEQEVIPPDVKKVIAPGDLEIGEFRIPCAVLEGGIRVISMRGMGKALGRGFGGNDWRRESSGGAGQLPYFLTANVLKPFIVNDVELVEFEPIFYTGGSRTGGVAHGIRAELIPHICEVWLKARAAGVLNKTQLPVAQRAEALMRGLAHIGIIALVDEATKYQEIREKDELQKILSAYLAPEFLPWAQRFPEEFYKEMFRLWGWPWPPVGGMANGPRGPRYAGKLTKWMVYDKLPSVVMEEIDKLNPADEKWQRRHRHYERLSGEVGLPHLDKQVAVVLNIMKVCDDKDEFLRKFEKAFPGTFEKGRQMSFMPKLADGDE